MIDRPNEGTVVVGGAILISSPAYIPLDNKNDISETETDIDNDDDDSLRYWTLTNTNCAKLIKESLNTRNVAFVKCHNDEVVGFSMALKMPVMIGLNTFNSLSVNGLLTQEQSENNAGTPPQVSLSAPYFLDNDEEDQWKQSVQSGSGGGGGNAVNNNQENGDKKSTNIQNNESKMVQQISDVTTFLSMSTAEKRNWIRLYSGIPAHKMPRPREGLKALDAAILPLLDIEVCIKS